jgi:hypothetical protein
MGYLRVGEDGTAPDRYGRDPRRRHGFQREVDAAAN